jgi:hypothetical protein
MRPAKAQRGAAPRQPLVDPPGSDADPAELEMENEIERREQFSKYSTPLLAAWELDYEEGTLPLARIAQREFILDLLARRKEQWPRSLQAAQAIWKKIFQPAAGDPVPGLHISEDDSPSPPLSPVPQDAAPQPGPAPLALPAPPPPSAAMFQAAVFRQCLVCCLSIPPDVAPLFICKGCDFRGDLGLGAPENQWRLQQRGLGQSSDPPAHASSAAPQLSRLDRLFATAAAAGVDQPLFVGPAAGALLPHTDALAEVRKCHNGTAYKHPSEQLVALVRAGKLASVAHAVPKPLEALGAGDDIKGGLELGANGALVARGADLQAPPVSSLAEFCAALF